MKFKEISTFALGVVGLSVLAETNKALRVVSLEADSDNIEIVEPAETNAKPQEVERKAATPPQPAVSVQADTITTQAAVVAGGEPKVTTATVKNLTPEGMVIPPSSEQAKTLEEAIRNIIAQAGKQVGTVSTNSISNLTMPYQQLGDGKGYEVEWRKALRILLSPVGYNFTEDGELVLFGLTAEVDLKHEQIAQERLTANRTPILFTTNESEDGMELRNAIRDVAVKAGVTITTDYMTPADLYIPKQSSAVAGKMNAEDIGKAKEKAVAQRDVVKRTKFDTNGQQIEWRTVLREILNPHDYDFVEVGGVVRIASRKKLADWEKDKLTAKPLTAKVVRLYHADPEQVVDRVMKIKGLLVHPNATLQATRKKDDVTGTVKNLNARIQTSSGQQSGMSDTTSQVFDKLLRPRTVPAIVVYDVEENLPNIEEKIKLFDIKEKQVLIEAIIFQITMNNGENGEMDGIKWEFPNTISGSFTPLYGSLGNVANIGDTFASELTKGGWKSGDWQNDSRDIWVAGQGFDFKATIELLRKQQNAKLMATPMLVIGDHSEAAIQDSRALPVLEIQRNVGYSTTATENYSYEWNIIREGTLMWVSPEITEGGKAVRLTVHPQVAEKTGEVTQTVEGIGEVKNYELEMREMDTRATVPSGSTLMFGGLIDNSEEEVEEKVRWLGDLPCIGWLFRSKTKKIVQKNLVILIRPTILEDGDMTGFETNALKQSESVMENSGRNMKTRPNGPYSIKETKERVKKYVNEHFIDPLDDLIVRDPIKKDGSEPKPTGTDEKSTPVK